LFSIIAHDLKSPFTAIIGLTEILVEEFNSLDRAGQLRFLSDLKSLSENTLKLLENLLQWAGSRTGKIMFRPKTLDMKLIASNVIIALYHIAEQKHVKLISMIPPDIQIYGDEKMVASVLRNLITNAIKFSHAGGSVTIGGRKTDEGVVISVVDTGVGMSTKEKEIIFVIDQIYSKRGTAGETGTGLGLILCKEFMDKHHGKIWAESTEGEGTTFYLLFPERDYYIVTN
jgi:signal transduction histidine kinase